MTTVTPDKLLNLDYLAATYAQKVIEETGKIEKATEVENAVTKALGILQENGVYACFLFGLSRVKRDDGGGSESFIMGVIVTQMLTLLKKLICDVSAGDGNKPDPQQILKDISEHVTQNLERLLLAKEVLEQMLIYARYGAKARSDIPSSSSQREQGGKP
ncbi:MAG: hypothetical protein HC884_05270 [Chloroflexaceae bacterium]|nr:hypothetical protein [Chloroflexaceae bacterium]